ncbi:MAG: transporter associated domain-containing protein [Anaerococcus sp.]|nr:transporter associated domain-containing protein [Anaerococcus sp.]
MGGFVIDHLSRIPVQGDIVEVDNIKITVDEVDRYKIEKLKVEFI